MAKTLTYRPSERDENLQEFSELFFFTLNKRWWTVTGVCMFRNGSYISVICPKVFEV